MNKMCQCEVCKKESGNGIIAMVGGNEVVICSRCIVLSDEPVVKKAREVMKTTKKSRENGEIKGDKVEWAAYWTPDCITPKFRKVR